MTMNLSSDLKSVNSLGRYCQITERGTTRYVECPGTLASICEESVRRKAKRKVHIKNIGNVMAH